MQGYSDSEGGTDPSWRREEVSIWGGGSSCTGRVLERESGGIFTEGGGRWAEEEHQSLYMCEEGNHLGL